MPLRKGKIRQGDKRPLDLSTAMRSEAGAARVPVIASAARFLAVAQITVMLAELTRRKPVQWPGAHPVPLSGEFFHADAGAV